MFCPVCGAWMRKDYKYCPKCGITSSTVNKTNQVKENNTVKTFKAFAAEKSSERQQFFKSSGRSNRKGKKPDELVTISIGIDSSTNGVMKPLRGKSLPLKVSKHASSETILSEALRKRSAYDKSFRTDRSYKLCYTDGTEVVALPGTKEKL